MADAGASLLLIGIGLFVFALVVTIYVATSRYKLAPSDQILVVYGNVKDKQSAECIHGGGKIVWPLIQHYAYLSLRPMTLNIPLKHALSKQNIRINVPSSFTIGISTEPSIMQNAATRLLGLPQSDIEKLAEDIIFGQLRLTVASLTIEQVNQDRDSFLRIVFTNVDTELHKLGLYLINVNVVDITDERQYIESIGTKAAETAVNEALVETARARSTGELGRAEADREREVGVAQNNAESEKGQKEAEVNRRIFVMQQEAMGKQGENVAAAEIADFEADLLVKQADARKRAEVAQRIAQKEIESAQYELEGERLRALEVVREEVSKQTVEIAAEAEAERQRRIAAWRARGLGGALGGHGRLQMEGRLRHHRVPPARSSRRAEALPADADGHLAHDVPGREAAHPARERLEQPRGGERVRPRQGVAWPLRSGEEEERTKRRDKSRQKKSEGEGATESDKDRAIYIYI